MRTKYINVKKKVQSGEWRWWRKVPASDTTLTVNSKERKLKIQEGTIKTIKHEDGKEYKN